VPTDVVTAQGIVSSSFVDKNVGTNKSVTGGTSNFDVADQNGKPVYGYTLQQDLRGDITPASLVISGLVANNKVYDATTLATLGGTASLGPVLGSDSVSLSGSSTGNFADKNVGTAKAVTLSGLSLVGADAGNYVLTQSGSLSADITQATLSVSGLVADNKVYDATTLATLSGFGSVGPVLGSDSVALSGASTGSFTDKNVGTGKAVTVTGLTLIGADAGNYVLTPPGSLSADITPATLSISGLVANDKVYDATTLATLSGTAGLSPVLGSDSVALSGASTGSFSDKNVGTGKAVAVTGLTLVGVDAGNYVLAQSGSLSADITPASLSISGLVASDKVYDATTLATLSGSASLSPALGSDSVSLSGSNTGTFSDSNVGTAKSVAVTGPTLAGADAGNYSLLPSVLSADISQATLLYVADPVLSVPGQQPPPFNGNVTGFKGSDSLADSTSGSASFTSSATSQSPPGSYGIFGGGLSATNYRFDQDPANQAALTIGLPSVPVTAAKEGPTTANDITVTSVIEPRTTITGPTGGFLDLTTPTAQPSAPAAAGNAVSSTGTGSQPNPFQAIDVASQSQAALGSLLVSRDAYKQDLFSQSISQLEQNPGLADVRPCLTLKEVEAGSCLLTESLKREWLASQASTSAPALPRVEAPKAAEPPSPSQTAAQSIPVIPEPPPPAHAQPAEAVALVSPSDALLGAKRRVVVAALPQIERKVALVIGVDTYKDPSIPTLSNSVKDARAFGKLLESQLGYETVVLENPGKQEVVAAMNRLALAMAPNDSMVVYYAGHGWVVESTKLGYWQLADSDAKQPQTWLSNNDIGKMIGQLGASQVALISDSCYSGSLVSSERIRATTKAVDPSQVLAQRTVVVMSSGGNEPVFDSGKNGHSPFAWSLMSTLGDLPAWQAGGNVFERVRFAVAKELPQRPQYGAFASAGQRNDGDYLFERRELAAIRQ
jgi:hypothetical protein